MNSQDIKVGKTYMNHGNMQSKVEVIAICRKNNEIILDIKKEIDIPFIPSGKYPGYYVFSLSTEAPQMTPVED